MDKDLKTQLNLETAQIAWSELAVFFASGKAIYVHESLDLIETACLIHQDDAEEIKRLMDKGWVAPVSDEQALNWTQQEAKPWSVVIRPWVLVQVKGV